MLTLSESTKSGFQTLKRFSDFPSPGSEVLEGRRWFHAECLLRSGIPSVGVEAGPHLPGDPYPQPLTLGRGAKQASKGPNKVCTGGWPIAGCPVTEGTRADITQSVDARSGQL